METMACNCGSNEKMVIACSGAADVGYISDQVSRKLSRNKFCKMSCMALFASCSEEKINELKTKDILVIDGCTEDCGKRVMMDRGIENYKWLRITDIGYEKGKTPTSQKTIQEVYDKAVVLTE